MRSAQEIKQEIEAAMMTESQIKITNELLLDIRTIMLTMVEKGGEKIAEPNAKTPDILIVDIEMSPSLRSALARGDIRSLAQVEGWTAQDYLKRIRHFGKAKLIELNEILAGYGKQIPGLQHIKDR
jgi:hypothetical protein